MLALLLAFLAVWLTLRWKWGFLPGGVALALSLGTYQAYLAVVLLLCIFLLMTDAAEGHFQWKKLFRMAGMGVLGAVLYFVVLQVMLRMQGVTLDTYQGINEMGRVTPGALPGLLLKAYYDFVAFGFRGNILFHNPFTLACFGILTVGGVFSLFAFGVSGAAVSRSKVVRKTVILRWCGLLLLILLIPPATNIVLLISADAYYHLLMRMQWVLFPMMSVIWTDRYFAGFWKNHVVHGTGRVPFWERIQKGWKHYVLPLVMAVAVLFVFENAVRANIAYFNMNERYEKTYAYCLRLVDRMEQTEDYVTGMPVAMIGEWSALYFPDTDITVDVTAPITGTSGSNLLYRRQQYAEFLRNYLGVTINVVSDEEMVRIYHSPEYQALDSFPGAGSMAVVDGILYIKTE
jgi:hypothetical protein